MRLLEIITWGFWLSPAVSYYIIWDPIIKPESFSSRVDNGRGLILRVMTKIPCYNLFITYSRTIFRIILIKKKQKIIYFHSAIEELRHEIRVTSFYMTSHFRGTLTSYVGMITSLRSKYMISNCQWRRADNPWAGNSISHIQTLGYRG